jgi:formyl-CoA transferase
MKLPLDGLTVLALEQAVAAPFATCRLADAGARVIKIERPEGDFARGYDSAANGESSYFVWLNRGKKSVVLDFAKDADRQSLAALIAQADVLVQNFKPGAMDRLGFPIAQLRERHPRLICCSISGYGDEGPYASRKAYDLLVQADSGLASITGGPDGPARVGISIVDIATGATAYAAILEALIARGISGEGADIRVSMFDVIADWMTVPLLHAENGAHPARMGLAHPSIAPYGVFAARDGTGILISIQNDREWKILCGAIGRKELADDPSFATNMARTANRQQTDDAVGAAFASSDASDLVARLDKADIAFAVVNDLHGLSRHPHLRRLTTQTPRGPIAYPAPAAIFDGVSRGAGDVPATGADTDAVLGSLKDRSRG